MSRWINHHDLTVAMETDHNDLNGIRAFLFEVLYCNSTTMIRNISQKTVDPESVRFSYYFSSKVSKITLILHGGLCTQYQKYGSQIT